MYTIIISLISILCSCSIILGIILYQNQIQVAQVAEKDKQLREITEKISQQEEVKRQEEIKKKNEVKKQETDKQEAGASLSKNKKQIFNKRYAECIESDGINLSTSACGLVNHQWEYDNRKLRHIPSNKCLSFDNNTQSIIINDCSETDRFQRWIYDENDFIKNSVTGRCLESDGSTIFANSCDDKSLFQKWDISDVI
jgi:hypothetical protein